MTTPTDWQSLRLAAGRTPLWRSPRSVQFGIDPWHAVLLDGLSPAQAEVVRRLDGSHHTADLLAAAGADRAQAAELLDQLLEAGIVEPGDGTDRTPPALLPDTAAWGLRTGYRCAEVVERRTGGTVMVHGNGRIAIGVATLLASAAVGAVVVRANGLVHGSDVGTGYRPEDVGQPRQEAAAAAVARARTIQGVQPDLPDVAVLTDAAVWDPSLTLRLTTERVPHLAVYAREASIVVGPLVLPGRTTCLRCTDLHRADRDPCWPRLAAQLSTLEAQAELAGAQVAVGMAAAQVLALLAGRGETPHPPPAVETTFEVDPLHCTVVRRRWPPHPRCGCGAVPARPASAAPEATTDPSSTAVPNTDD